MKMLSFFVFPALLLCLLLSFSAPDGPGSGLSALFTEKAPAPLGPYSQAVKSGGQIFLSGQIGVLPESGKLIDGGIKNETRQALKNLAEVLKAAGCSETDVVKCTVYLGNMSDFSAFNEEYAAFFKDWKPARETIGVAALPAGASVEISALARIPR
jgi:2-iminobutanoate/2-iminopropanoate deaminase